MDEQWKLAAKIVDLYEAPDWVELVLDEHKAESAPHPDGTWKWSCSCGKKGVSADRRDHWADVTIKRINECEMERYGRVRPREPVRWRLLREVIFSAIDQELERSKQ